MRSEVTHFNGFSLTYVGRNTDLWSRVSTYVRETKCCFRFVGRALISFSWWPKMPSFLRFKTAIFTKRDFRSRSGYCVLCFRHFWSFLSGVSISQFIGAGMLLLFVVLCRYPANARSSCCFGVETAKQRVAKINMEGDCWPLFCFGNLRAGNFILFLLIF